MLRALSHRVAAGDVTALKTLTYGLMHFMVAVAVAYAVTGDAAVALGVGILEPLIQTVFYTLHERLWAGRATSPTAHAH